MGGALQFRKWPALEGAERLRRRNRREISVSDAMKSVFSSRRTMATAAILFGSFLHFFGWFAFANAEGTKLPELQVIQELPRPGDTYGVIWSSDGTKLAAFTNGPTANVLGTFLMPSPGGNLLTIWNSDGQILREIRRPDGFFTVDDKPAFVAGDREIVTPPPFTSTDLAFSVFDVSTGEVVREISGPSPERLGANNRAFNAARIIVASPDQTILAAVLGHSVPAPLVLYSTRDWSKLATLQKEGVQLTDPRACAFSSDGKFLAVSRLDGRVLIYEVETRRVIQTIEPFSGLISTPNTMSFSPDGATIAVGAGFLGDKRVERTVGSDSARPSGRCAFSA